MFEASVGDERLKVDPPVGPLATPTQPAFEQRRSAERQQQQRHIAVDLDQVCQEVQALVVCPMQVFELQHDG